MLSSLGSTEHISSSELCCDICSIGKVPYVRVDVVSMVRRKSHRKPEAVRVVDTALKKRLYQRLADERRKVMEENPSYSILGSSVVCSNTVLHAICERASYVSALEHMDIFFLRPELKERFYYVVRDVLVSAPLICRR